MKHKRPGGEAELIRAAAKLASPHLGANPMTNIPISLEAKQWPTLDHQVDGVERGGEVSFARFVSQTRGVRDGARNGFAAPLQLTA